MDFDVIAQDGEALLALLSSWLLAPCPPTPPRTPEALHTYSEWVSCVKLACAARVSPDTACAGCERPIRDDAEDVYCCGRCQEEGVVRAWFHPACWQQSPTCAACGGHLVE